MGEWEYKVVEDIILQCVKNNLSSVTLCFNYSDIDADEMNINIDDLVSKLSYKGFSVLSEKLPDSVQVHIEW